MPDSLPVKKAPTNKSPEVSPVPVEVANAEPLQVQLTHPAATAAPLPVLIAAEQEPVPVVVQETQAAPVVMPPTVNKKEGVTLPPTTTEEGDRVTAGQRLINILWESTQSIIALTVVVFTMVKAFMLNQGQDIPTIMAVAFGTIVGFYFSRVNHERVGGVGPKPNPGPYTGR